MENNKGKAKNFLQKMYNFRVKVDRKGKPVVNVSSIFGLACLIFAPHMTIVGVVASLVLGYQIHFESEDDDGEIEEKIRKAAMNVKAGVTGAVKSVQNEISRARTENASRAAAQPQAEPQAQTAPEKAAEPDSSNEDLLKDLAAKAEENTGSNPAATTFHSAYAASAGSVPVLKISEEPAGTPETGAGQKSAGAE